MTINEYIGRIAKTYINYYGALVNAASYFGEVIEDTFDYIGEDYCHGRWHGSVYVISVKTDDGVKNVAVTTRWEEDYYLDDVEVLEVYDNYNEDGYNYARYLIDRDGNLYKRNEDGLRAEKVER